MKFLKLKYNVEESGMLDYNAQSKYVIQDNDNEEQFFNTKNDFLTLQCSLKAQSIFNNNVKATGIYGKKQFLYPIYKNLKHGLISKISIIERFSNKILYNKEFKCIMQDTNVIFKEIATQHFASEYLPIGGRYNPINNKIEQIFCCFNVKNNKEYVELLSLSELLAKTSSIISYTSLADDICSGKIKYTHNNAEYTSCDFIKYTTTSNFCTVILKKFNVDTAS